MIPRERVLDLCQYSHYDARYPVICRDEQPKPLQADKRPPQPARPGHPATYDYEYVRRGPCTLWMFRWARGTRAWTGYTRCRPLRIILATARLSAGSWSAAI